MSEEPDLMDAVESISEAKTLTDLLSAVCMPVGRAQIADIGANPLSAPPYEAMRLADMCDLFGFEPQEGAYETLAATARPGDRYFKAAVGPKGSATFYVYDRSGFSSLYQLCAGSLAALTSFKAVPNRMRTVEVDLTPLDEIADVPQLDMLKIDVQGAERDIIAGGRARLSGAVCVIAELRYNRLYVGEPMLGDVDLELRAQGFTLHKFTNFSAVHLRNSQSQRLRFRRMKSQLVDGDAVYIRALETMQEWSDHQLACLAQFAGLVFKSHDLALQCLDVLVARGRIDPLVPARYVDLLPKQLRV